MGDNFINVLSDEEFPPYEHGFVTEEMIKKHRNSESKYIYLCGPKATMKAMQAIFESLGIEKEYIVKEGF